MNADSFCLDYSWDADGDEPPNLDLEPMLSALARALNLSAFELSLVFTGDDAVRRLNRDYRGKDLSTDVLSFPQSTAPFSNNWRHLGDIVISVPQAARQAAEIGQTLVVELRFLVLHGLLHLLGYDHETDRGEMLALQTSLKERFNAYF